MNQCVSNDAFELHQLFVILSFGAYQQVLTLMVKVYNFMWQFTILSALSRVANAQGNTNTSGWCCWQSRCLAAMRNLSISSLFEGDRDQNKILSIWTS